MSGISKLVGEARCADGRPRPLYEALRELICAACAASIREGERFTRHAVLGVGAALLPRCGRCAPFERLGSGGSPLLRSLLKPGHEEGAQPAEPRREAAKEVERRLGPALARSRKRRA